MPELTEPYVLGLLADLEDEVPRMEGELARARKRASSIDAELSNLIRRLDESKTALQEAQARAADSPAIPSRAPIPTPCPRPPAAAGETSDHEPSAARRNSTDPGMVAVTLPGTRTVPTFIPS